MAMIALKVLFVCGLSTVLCSSMAAEVCNEGDSEAECGQRSAEAQALLQVTNTVQRGDRTTGIPHCPSDCICCTEQSGDVEHVKAIKYGRAYFDGKMIDLVLDTFRLKDWKGTRLPVLMHVHGGGFYPSNPYNRDSNVKRNEIYAKRRVLVVAIMYRLHGWMGWVFKQKQMFMDPVHDTLAAVRYVKANADTLEARADIIMIIGGSAGGMTVTNVGMMDCGEGTSGTPGEPSNVSLVVSMAGGMGGSAYNALRSGGGKYKKAADIPPYLGIHSTNDGTVSIKDTVSAISTMKKLAVPDENIDFIELAGSEHTPMFWRVSGTKNNNYLIEDIIAWALKHLDHPLCPIDDANAVEVEG